MLVSFADSSDRFWSDRRWGHVDDVVVGRNHACCRGFSSVPGPLQTVQRAEMWGVILALQSCRALHLGVDNLGGCSSMLVGCWMGVEVLFLLSWLMMGTSSF